MGTRHLICGVVDGKMKLAQYGQWDGYPTGQGARILDFLNWNETNMDRFRDNLRKCVEVTPEVLEESWRQAGADPNEQFVSCAIADKHTKLYPEFSRDTGADILDLIMERPYQLKLSIDFAKDSLFCEWAYVLDMDRNVLEVYKGFNKKPVPASNRFQGELKKPYDKADCSYGPVVLVKEYPFSDLPSTEQMDMDCDPPDPEEDDED